MKVKYDKNYESLTYNVKKEFFDSSLPYSYEQIEARTNYLVYNYSLVAKKI